MGSYSGFYISNAISYKSDLSRIQIENSQIDDETKSAISLASW